MNKVSVQQVLSAENPLRLDDEWDGSCPCGRIVGINFIIDTHCWRVGTCCEYSGTHVTGDLDDSTRQELANYVARFVWYESTAKITPMEGRVY